MIALQQVNSISYARTFQVSIYVNEHRLRAMIDSSATENFMTKTLIEEKNFSTRKKSVVYDLITIDEQLLTDQDEKVNEKTKSLQVTTQRHYETFTFDVIRIISHDVVLRIS